jgi:hypothetical protein
VTKGKARMLDLREQVLDVRAQGRTLWIALRLRGGGKLRSILEALLGRDPLGPGMSLTKESVVFDSAEAPETTPERPREAAPCAPSP